MRICAFLNVFVEMHSSLLLDWLVGRDSKEHSVETATLLRKKKQTFCTMSSSSSNLVYLFAFCILFPKWTKILYIHCDMWMSCLNWISHFLHTVFLEMLKSKELTNVKKKKKNLLFSVSYFSQLSSQIFKFHCIPPLEPEQEPARVLVTVFPLLCSYCSLPGLHSCPLHEPTLDLLLPNKSFFSDTILSPSFL